MKLLVLPGWGTPPTLLRPIEQALPTFEFSYASYDGVSAAGDFDRSVRDQVLRAEPDMLLGWSLGALLALRHAAAPVVSLRGLVLLSPFASFVTRPGHEDGWDPRVLRRMRERLVERRAQVVDDFARRLLAPGERDGLEALLTEVRTEHDRPISELGAGLTYLTEQEALSSVSFINLPVLLLHGASDVITPVGSVRWLEEALGDRATTQVIAGAGHALSFTRADAVAKHIVDWVEGIR